ncbi:SDR family oxidoreductase [Brevibacterium ravenspurgense]|uniref:SDR family NAD(P)-dependent oxidoreductase n=1 Tax=Brevibacterium ravenspurgense TaxID=479117 RepID=UPI001EF31B29|nr:SDR family NAD(P)-dependent oxidoreductase [Brevibacterium ravenspurgense]MCG7299986.1 SDR family oxidoreductase [Brevibacterium ravenspurgense]
MEPPAVLRTALVTGAASGIGAAIVTALLRRGDTVVGLDLAAEGLEQFAWAGDSFVGRVGDVTVEKDLEDGVATAVEEFGRLDVAFNSAGVSKGAPIVDLDEEKWDFTVDRVLKGVFLSTKHEALAMREFGGGSIVNISSLNAHVPMHTGAAYSSAKAGVEMFTKNAALELAVDQIRINAVLPGLIDTPLTKRRLVNKPLMEVWLDRIPLGRPGLPEDVAKACLFLAGDDAAYITGTSLVVDGGWEITGYPDLRALA